MGLLNVGMHSTVSDRQREELLSLTALGRLTDVSNVIKTVDFLASEASLSITGERIHIDAGVL